MPKCLFHVISIGVTNCSWNLLFAIFVIVYFIVFGGGFEIVWVGLRRCLKGRAKKRERRERREREGGVA